MKYKLTFSQYDSLIERMEKLKTTPVWPTLRIMDKKAIEIQDNPAELEKWVLYCCFVAELGEVKNKADEYAKKNINLFLRDTLDFVDDISITHPEIASEWHPTKNGNLTPEKVYSGSQQVVWWQDQAGNEWQESVADRTKLFDSQ